MLANNRLQRTALRAAAETLAKIKSLAQVLLNGDFG
jgi:hypothetical protein